MKQAFLFILLTVEIIAFAQVPADSLNRRNAKNQKHGFWKVYLSDKLIGIKDSAKAYYYSYDYYDNGQLVIYAGGAARIKKKTIKVTGEGVNTIQGQPILLDGNFKWYHAKGLAVDETYSKGLPVMLSTFDPKENGETVKVETLDYTRRYQDQFGSFYYELYYSNGEVAKKYWFAKNKKGKWTAVPAK